MLNMDFSKQVVINTQKCEWQPSPMPGVWRKPLAREDAERGHATSIVRYDAGAHFSAHDHPKGEEILVLEGTFSDETGDYPAGTYFRNPEGFRHAPFSKQGCTILVKLHQFQPNDNHHLQINTLKSVWIESSHGVRILPLHQFEKEQVSMVSLSAGGQMPQLLENEEIFVIRGVLSDDENHYPARSWIRTPSSQSHSQTLWQHGEEDTLLWVKRGHF